MSDSLRVPWGYGSSTITIGGLRTHLLEHYHPEYVRRLIAWLVSRNGAIGVGGTWRADGTQPTDPGFAPEGRSFHQNQRYSDGFIGACAVDLVAPDGPDGNNSHDTVTWNAVLPQGTPQSVLWGLHCNVGAPGQPGSEAWHMQPIEIDGWESWIAAGSPAPRPNYPIPGPVPVPLPPPTIGGHVLLYKVVSGDSYWRIAEKVHEDGKATNARVAAIQQANASVALRPDMIINIPGRLS